jgi:hypothetical protein
VSIAHTLTSEERLTELDIGPLQGHARHLAVDPRRPRRQPLRADPGRAGHRRRRHPPQYCRRHRVRAPWCPYSNHLELAYFALVFALMFFAPGFRTGFYVFPARLIGLFIVALAHQRYTGRAGRAAAVPAGQPLGADKT